MNIARTVYSVPSRLIGETVKVRQYEERLDIWYGGARQEMIPRIALGNGALLSYGIGDKMFCNYVRPSHAQSPRG